MSGRALFLLFVAHRALAVAAEDAIGGTLRVTDLPSAGQTILLVAQATYFGLSAAVSHHTTAWKHPWGETAVISASILVIISSAAHLVLIQLASKGFFAGEGGERPEWLLALHVVLPSPLLVPVLCFWCYRLFGGLAWYRAAMRRAVAPWEVRRGNSVPYEVLTFLFLRTWADLSWRTLLRAAPVVAINAIVAASTFYSLHLLAFPPLGSQPGIIYPFWSAVVVVVLSGVLGALPGLPQPGNEVQADNAVVAPLAQVKSRVFGDQIVVPVLGWSDATSVIIISYCRWRDTIHLSRYSTNLQFTPFRRSKHKEAMSALTSTPPPARMAGEDNTNAFVEHFKSAFTELSTMFYKCASAHSISPLFVQRILERRHHILNNVRVFDGNCSKMAALVYLVTNMVISVAAQNDKERLPEYYRIYSREVDSVADLFAWGFSRFGGHGVGYNGLQEGGTLEEIRRNESHSADQLRGTTQPPAVGDRSKPEPAMDLPSRETARKVGTDVPRFECREATATHPQGTVTLQLAGRCLHEPSDDKDDAGARFPLISAARPGCQWPVAGTHDRSFKLRDKNGDAYNMDALDAMVRDLSSKQRHDVMLFLFLEWMARSNDTRLVQLDSMCQGHDATVSVAPLGDITVKTWSVDKNLATQLASDVEEWQRRYNATAFQRVMEDPADHIRAEGQAFDRISGVAVPVAWNAFWVFYQHVLTWLLRYMAGSIVVILFDTLLGDSKSG